MSQQESEEKTTIRTMRLAFYLMFVWMLWYSCDPTMKKKGPGKEQIGHFGVANLSLLKFFITRPKMVVENNIHKFPVGST